MTEATEFEWVDEIPSRKGGGKAGGGKYAALYQTLAAKPGKIAKLGPMGQGSASGVVARMKELGAVATSRTVDGKSFVFVNVPEPEAKPDPKAESESIFDAEVD